METKGEVPLTGVKINWNILPKSAPPVYELTIIPTLEPMRTFCFRTGSGMDKELVDVVLRESVEGRNLERVLKLLREKVRRGGCRVLRVLNSNTFSFLSAGLGPRGR